MSYLSVARTAIKAKAAAVPGIKHAYPRLPDTIADAPALVLGQYTWTTSPGDRERTTYIFDLALYVERLADDDQTIAAADDLVEAIQNDFAKGITLGQTGATTECTIVAGTANEWVQVAETVYLTVVFRLALKGTHARGYTP